MCRLWDHLRAVLDLFACVILWETVLFLTGPCVTESPPTWALYLPVLRVGALPVVCSVPLSCTVYLSPFLCPVYDIPTSALSCDYLACAWSCRLPAMHMAMPYPLHIRYPTLPCLFFILPCARSIPVPNPAQCPFCLMSQLALGSPSPFVNALKCGALLFLANDRSMV